VRSSREEIKHDASTVTHDNTMFMRRGRKAGARLENRRQAEKKKVYRRKESRTQTGVGRIP